MHFTKATAALILGFVVASPIAASPVPLTQGVAVRDAAALVEARSVEAPLQARAHKKSAGRGRNFQTHGHLKARKGPAPSHTIQSGGRLISARSVEAPLEARKKAADGPAVQLNGVPPFTNRARSDDDDVPWSHAETSDSEHPPITRSIDASLEARMKSVGGKEFKTTGPIGSRGEARTSDETDINW